MPANSLNSQKDNNQCTDWKAFFKKLLQSAFSAFPSELKFFPRAEIHSLRFTPPAKDNQPERNNP